MYKLTYTHEGEKARSIWRPLAVATTFEEISIIEIMEQLMIQYEGAVRFEVLSNKTIAIIDKENDKCYARIKKIEEIK